MLDKMIAVLGGLKGAAAVAAITAVTVTGAVASTDSRFGGPQGEEGEHAVAAASTHTPKPSHSPEASDADESARPAVVASRNEADARLRDAFQKDHQALERLRRSDATGSEHATVNKLVNSADSALRARLTLALDAVGGLTLGRTGRQDRAPSPSASASPSPSASPTASPAPTASAAPGAVNQAAVDAIVSAAIADMDKIVTDATAALAALPSASPSTGGKPSDAPRGKPSDVPRGRSEEAHP